jgi:general stress protein 26
MFLQEPIRNRFARNRATGLAVRHPKEPIMSDDRQRDEELKQQFWEALADSPYLFLQLDSDPTSAVPMTAALDENANGAIWFFTGRDHAFARGGAATATFAAKGHDVFARFKGSLSEETSRERLDKEWSNFVEAYFPRGKDDPNLLMLRMDLADAEIWTTDIGLATMVRMALGHDVREDTRDQHAETAL